MLRHPYPQCQTNRYTVSPFPTSSNTMPFAQLGLIQPLLQSLNYSSPTAIQTQAIPLILQGRDLIAAAQTGTGKTAAFALPLLQRLSQQGPRVASNAVRALILVPTRELAVQLHQRISEYAQGLPLRSLAVYGGVSINPQMQALRKGIDLLVATPGRLLDLQRSNAVHFRQLQILVVDEADRLLDMGFADELHALQRLLPTRRQTLLFSATLSPAVRDLASHLTREAVSLDISPQQLDASTLSQWIIPVDRKRKGELLLHLLRQHKGSRVLAFGKNRQTLEQLLPAIQALGINVDLIHGDRPQPARLRALNRFQSGEIDLLLATDVAARGLDIEQLPMVINIDLPLKAEDYVHRIGRSGRAGSQGNAISLVSADEARQLASIEQLLQRLLDRRDEAGFTPEHRLPQTSLDGQLIKKPKKPKKPKQAAPANSPANRIHLGDWS